MTPSALATPTASEHPSSPTTPSTAAALRDRLAGMGIVLLELDAQHKPLPFGPDAERGWLVRLLTASPMVRGTLAQRLSQDSGADGLEHRAIELLPGLWAAVRVHRARRRATGCTVGLIPTRHLLESEQFIALCQAAQLDAQITRALLAQLPPARVEDVPRLAALLRMVLDESGRRSADADAIESIGKQLADSYEEMNLLYTIIAKMTVRQKPERFIEQMSHELLETLPYAWCAAIFSADSSQLKSLSDQCIFEGTCPVSRTRVHELGRQVLNIAADADAPFVVEPGHDEAQIALSDLGSSVIVAPIMWAGRGVGVLLAGDKQGADTRASSIDLKLLGAAASNLSVFLENAALYDDLNAMFLGTLEALTAAIDAKDRYTCGHSQRVALLTQQLARAVGMDEETIARMRIAGLVHDVGKIGVPEAVLSKPGKLTDEEFALIRLHPEIGHRILRDIPQLRDVLGGVLHHHERWDGRGYPRSLKGEEIPLVARLIGLADSFDAMSSTRTYRSALSREAVLAEVARCAGAQFDPDLARAFVKLDFAEYDRMVAEHRAGAVPPHAPAPENHAAPSHAPTGAQPSAPAQGRAA